MLENLDFTFKNYDLSQCCTFLKTDERFGGLSNMEGTNFKLKINGVSIRSTEHLYQICKYPDHPEVQELILHEASPMSAKMKQKPFMKTCMRKDFDAVKVDIMYWCLLLKLSQYPGNITSLLNITRDRDIVEISRKDDFWGVKVDKENPKMGVGQNVLGKLWSEVRKFRNEHQDDRAYLKVTPPAIENFKLWGNEIGELVNPIFYK